MNKHYLNQLYLVEGKTMSEIAKILNVNEGKVRYQLNKLGIKRPKKEFNPEFKAPLSEQFLTENYINQNKSLEQMIVEYGISESKIRKGLSKYGIKKPDTLKFKKGDKNLTPEQLKAWYDEKLLLKEMSKLSGCHYTTIKRLLKRWLGIEWTKEDTYSKRSKEGPKKRKKTMEAKRKRQQQEKEAKRVRNRKKGGKMKLESRINSRITKARKRSMKGSATKAELKMEQVLDELGITYNSQYSVDFYLKQQGIESQFDSMPVDFLVHHPQNNGIKILLEVDSTFHHVEIDKNVRRDKRKNYLLVNAGYIVIRIPTSVISKELIMKLLSVGSKLDEPKLIKVDGAPKYIRKTGPKQTIDLKIVVEDPGFQSDPILD